MGAQGHTLAGNMAGLHHPRTTALGCLQTGKSRVVVAGNHDDITGGETQEAALRSQCQSVLACVRHPAHQQPQVLDRKGVPITWAGEGMQPENASLTRQKLLPKSTCCLTGSSTSLHPHPHPQVEGPGLHPECAPGPTCWSGFRWVDLLHSDKGPGMHESPDSRICLKHLPAPPPHLPTSLRLQHPPPRSCSGTLGGAP